LANKILTVAHRLPKPDDISKKKRKKEKIGRMLYIRNYGYILFDPDIQTLVVFLQVNPILDVVVCFQHLSFFSIRKRTSLLTIILIRLDTFSLGERNNE
jgi:hypothetical protein